jgi:2-dehydro-3-deoxyphosphooctonate aldolase (KDO 8-P synthase)
LAILGRIRKDLNIEVLTDVHETDEAITAAMFVDILQIPAFLCRQTELIQTAAKSKSIINIKKGQFASWETMAFAAEKALYVNKNCEVLLTERGSTFGYDDLIVDMRNVQLMKQINAHVIVDITHSLGTFKGYPTMIEMLGRCGMAAGADGLFLETHPSPISALSDSASMLPLDQVENVIHQALKIREAMA